MTATRMIDQAGVYPGIPDAVYHNDPVIYSSLSSTAVRRTLRSPAHGREYVDNGREDTGYFDYGKAAHTLALGTGPDIEVYPVLDERGEPVSTWQTRAAQEFRRKIRERGDVPMLVKEHKRVTAMVRALQAHPKWAMLKRRSGASEVTVVGQDPETGLWTRAKLDHFPRFTAPGGGPLTGRVIVWDYKTTEDASEAGIRNTIWRYRYDVQAVHILLTMLWAGLPVDPVETPFLLVCQETHPPFVVTVVEIGPRTMERALKHHQSALRAWADGLVSGYFPPYRDDVVLIEVADWVDRTYLGEDDLP